MGGLFFLVLATTLDREKIAEHIYMTAKSWGREEDNTYTGTTLNMHVCAHICMLYTNTQCTCKIHTFICRRAHYLYAHICVHNKYTYHTYIHNTKMCIILTYPYTFITHAHIDMPSICTYIYNTTHNTHTPDSTQCRLCFQRTRRYGTHRNWFNAESP